MNDIAAVRAFARFYTRRIGILDPHLLGGPFSLTEARILFELAHRDAPTATEIAAALDLDSGYLSRIIQTFADRKLVRRTPAPEDRRQNRLSLTAAGRETVATLENNSNQAVAAMLDALTPSQRARLTGAMAAIQTLLTEPAAAPAATLRPHRPGDIGRIVQAHGELYAREYGFDSSFESLVAQIAGQFLATFDPSREGCWIAELDGRPVGSLVLVRASDDVAKFRLLYVDPDARGHGIGRLLVQAGIEFAKARGYRKITLWTQSILDAARAIYGAAGFRLVASEPHRSFGRDLIGETWELDLGA